MNTSSGVVYVLTYVTQDFFLSHTLYSVLKWLTHFCNSQFISLIVCLERNFNVKTKLFGTVLCKCQYGQCEFYAELTQHVPPLAHLYLFQPTDNVDLIIYFKNQHSVTDIDFVLGTLTQSWTSALFFFMFTIFWEPSNWLRVQTSQNRASVLFLN